jgi:hypothetical protein
LAELQAKEPSQRPRRKIGFVQEEEKWNVQRQKELKSDSCLNREYVL